MISIKQYAEERGKSTQAVHQQRKRQKYQARLKGHITKKDGVYYLDEEAVKILDSAHESSPMIVDTTTKKKIQELEKELEAAKERETKLLDEYNVALKKLQNQTEQMAQMMLDNQKKTMLLEQKEDQEAKIDSLVQENAELKAKNDQLVKEAEVRSSSEDHNEPKKGFFARLFGK